MYLTKADLKTHIYPEIMEEISRDDDDIVNNGISTAIDLARSYLSRYDTIALFGTDIDAPTQDAPMLKNFIKDIATWYILTLCNANMNLELFEKKYDDAQKWLRDIQKGMSNPEWAYRNLENDPKPPDGDTVAYTSNPKRTNHW